jgi:hypothetical protein
MWIASGCATNRSQDISAEALQTPEGLAEWERGEKTLKASLEAAQTQYHQDNAMLSLQQYEGAVRQYLDHGFGLYRATRTSSTAGVPNLLQSLERRTNLLMDVADEYIKQGSTAVGESIAADVIHNYSDLPTMAPAQRRAEAVLLRYRYRQDY